MIRVNGWTNHMEKIGNKEYHVSVDGYKNYLVKIYNGAEIFPSQTVTFGDLGKVESFLNEEARKKYQNFFMISNTDASRGVHIGIEVHGTVMKKYWRFKGKIKVTTGRRMYKIND